MGTTKTTKQTSQYDPGSMSAFQQLTPAWSKQAQGFIQNPYGNPQFQFERQMGQQNANLQNQTNMSQLLHNFNMSGMNSGVMSPALQEMMNNQMRAGTQNAALQGFINPTQMANQRQQYSMGLAQGYHPLQTGSTQKESTGGLGSWLPQVAGIGLGAATGGLGMIPGVAGGMGGMFKGALRSMGYGGWGGAQGGQQSGGSSNPFFGSPAYGPNLGTMPQGNFPQWSPFGQSTPPMYPSPGQ